jgi:hypothetical protein
VIVKKTPVKEPVVAPKAEEKISKPKNDFLSNVMTGKEDFPSVTSKDLKEKVEAQQQSRPIAQRPVQSNNNTARPPFQRPTQ